MHRVAIVGRVQRKRDESHVFIDISEWDVSSVTDVSGMIFDARAFNGDIPNWDVSSVADVCGMF